MTNPSTTPEIIDRIKSRLLAESAENTRGQRARVHALRPQSTGQFYAMPHEDREAFNLHCKGIIEDFNPQSHRERWYATAIAEDMWRLDRARAIENNIFSVGISGPIGLASTADSPEVHAAVCHARVWLQDARQIQALALYEHRVRRNLEKNEKHLNQLQAERKAAHRKALEEALILFELAVSESRPYDPAEDAAPGESVIVFSAEELTRFARRETRLATGRNLGKDKTQGHNE